MATVVRNELAMFSPFGRGELRLLRRLVINPSLKQATLAKELGISRSAVNQLWRKLELERGLSIGSIFDFGSLGFDTVFGWANDREGSDTIRKFSRWLRSNPYVSIIIASRISSMMDQRVYFEARTPLGQRTSLFLEQLNRFTKRPYSLSLTYESASYMAHHMNLGLFDGRSWEVLDGFRFGATIESARSYVDVLPSALTAEQSTPALLNLEQLAIASVLEEDYHASSKELENGLEELHLPTLSERTLRRRLSLIRKENVTPYVNVNEIGLSQRILVCIEEEANHSGLSLLLKAQATTLPKARVVGGHSLTAIILDLPESASWFALSKVLSEQAGMSTKMCTFIADDSQVWKGLASLVIYEASRLNQ